jgi:mono/diheme cytochrome c family protein
VTGLQVALVLGLVLAAAASRAEVDPSSPEALVPDPGRNLWVKRCAYCHGEEGTAHNVLGLRYGARNFTDVSWQSRTSDEQIRRSILEGVRGTKMRAFRGYYTDPEVTLLLGVIRGFRGTKIGDGTTP